MKVKSDTLRTLISVLHHFFGLFCVGRLSPMCVKVFPTLKKRTNQSTSVIKVGLSDSFMHGYYISVYKAQDEMYLYRWRRGGETGKLQLGSELLFK